YPHITPQRVQKLQSCFYLRLILSMYVCRRTKFDVRLNLPSKKNMVIYCGLTDLQKSLYKAYLLKNETSLLQLANGKSVQTLKSLNSVILSLNKVSNHPYLIPGIEKPPFTM